MSAQFEPIGEFYRRNGYGHAPACKCPEYWECGEYATEARAGSKPGKVQIHCAYHARRVEKAEAAAAAEVRP